MNPGFSLKPLPAITFGLGCLDRLSEIGESLGSRVLIITGDSFRPRQKTWTTVEKELLENGMRINYVTVSSEPSPEIIDRIVDTYHPEKLDGIIAIGGGSVLDTGKAVAAMLPAGEKIEQFLEDVGNQITLEKLRELVSSDARYQHYIDKYRRLGRLCCEQRKSTHDEADCFIEELHRIIDLLKLPCLSDYGATPEDLDALLDGASLKNNPAPLSNEDIRKILLHRL